MFQQLKNIDTAFKHIRLFSYLLIAACTSVTCYAIYKSYQSSTDFKNHIYILANGKALEAFAADQKTNTPVEARDHIKVFHEDFFNLSPDDKQIQATVTKALYLADASAKTQYDNLKESGFYSNLITGNISQQVNIDSIKLDINQYPYAFICFATERLIRTSGSVNRSLITQGYLRNVPRSDNNPHGFLIERWEIIQNQDINNPTPGHENRRTRRADSRQDYPQANQNGRLPEPKNPTLEPGIQINCAARFLPGIRQRLHLFNH